MEAIGQECCSLNRPEIMLGEGWDCQPGGSQLNAVGGRDIYLLFRLALCPVDLCTQ